MSLKENEGQQSKSQSSTKRSKRSQDIRQFYVAQDAGASSSNPDSNADDLDIDSALTKIEGFTNQEKHKSMFEKFYIYVGHDKNLTRFYATCKLCKTKGKSKRYSFDLHNFKTNGTRHMQTQHPEVELNDEISTHDITKFLILDKTSKYSKKDVLQNRFSDNILDIVAVDGQPFTVVEGLGFRNTILDINSRLNIPSERTIRRKIELKVEKQAKPALIESLKDVGPKDLHLSTDLWSSRRGDSIIGVMGHYITEVENKDWELCSATLAVKEFNRRHTADNIRDKLTDCLSKLNIIVPQLGHVTTDGASNMVSAFKNWDHVNNCDTSINNPPSEDEPEQMDTSSDGIDEDNELSEVSESDEALDMIINDDESCFDEEIQCPGSDIVCEAQRISCKAHRLQLVVKAAFEKCDAPQLILDSVRKLVKFFHQSTLWRIRLKSIIGKDLIQPAATRWNIYYYVIKQLSNEEVFKAVANVILEASLSGTKSKSLPKIPESDMRVKLVELQSLLAPLSSATNNLQAGGVTSCLIIYNIISAFDEITKVDVHEFADLKIELLQGIIDRFEGEINQDGYAILSAVLDPRQKLDVFKMKVGTCGFVTLKTPSDVAAINFLNSMYVTPDLEQSSPNSVERNKHAREEENPFSKLSNFSSTDSLELDEVTRYLALPREPPTSNPLSFWSNHKAIFPGLSKLAKRYLAIPASSGGVERLFSLTGSLGRRGRAKMKPRTMENLVLWKQFRLPTLKKKFQVKNGPPEKRRRVEKPNEELVECD